MQFLGFVLGFIGLAILVPVFLGLAALAGGGLAITTDWFTFGAIAAFAKATTGLGLFEFGAGIGFAGAFLGGSAKAVAVASSSSRSTSY